MQEDSADMCKRTVEVTFLRLCVWKKSSERVNLVFADVLAFVLV